MLDRAGVQLLPNTAGCFTARDAVLTAKMAREAFETDWVKLEVIGDERTLLPDAPALPRPPRSSSTTASSSCPTRTTTRSSPAAWRTSAAPRSCRSARRSAAAWACSTRTTCALIRERASVPVILDAGVGTASDAALAMELGFDAVLCATAISRAEDPETMARAIRLGVEAGRLAYRAGRIPRRLYAQASTPDERLPEY